MKNQYGEIVPYALTDDQYYTLQQVADTLFTLTDNIEHRKGNITLEQAAMGNCLSLLQNQLYSVLNADLSPLKD